MAVVVVVVAVVVGEDSSPGSSGGVDAVGWGRQEWELESTIPVDSEEE